MEEKKLLNRKIAVEVKGVGSGRLWCARAAFQLRLWWFRWIHNDFYSFIFYFLLYLWFVALIVFCGLMWCWSLMMKIVVEFEWMKRIWSWRLKESYYGWKVDGRWWIYEVVKSRFRVRKTKVSFIFFIFFSFFFSTKCEWERLNLEFCSFCFCLDCVVWFVFILIFSLT